MAKKKRISRRGTAEYWLKSCHDQLGLADQAVILKGSSAHRTPKPSDAKKASNVTVRSALAIVPSDCALKTDWVQCDECDKWHALPHDVSPDDLPDRWCCRMNTWNSNASPCDVVVVGREPQQAPSAVHAYIGSPVESSPTISKDATPHAINTSRPTCTVDKVVSSTIPSSNNGDRNGIVVPLSKDVSDAMVTLCSRRVNAIDHPDKSLQVWEPMEALTTHVNESQEIHEDRVKIENNDLLTLIETILQTH